MTEIDNEAVEMTEVEKSDPHHAESHGDHFHEPEGMFWDKIVALHKHGAERPRCCYCCGCGFFWIFFFIIIINMAQDTGMIVMDTANIPFFLYGDFDAARRGDGAYWGQVDCTYSFDTTAPRTREVSNGGNPRLMQFYRKEGGNIMTEEYLTNIQKFEEDMTAKHDWAAEMCLNAYPTGDENPVCIRESSGLSFFAAEDAYFPIDYDDYPTVANTQKYYSSLIYNPLQPTSAITYDLTQENIDRVTEFWASYGRTDVELENQTFETTPSYLQYFDRDVCMLQYESCPLGFNAADECVDDFTAILTAEQEATALENGVTNCVEAFAVLKDMGFGCDDNLGTFELPDKTLREACCATCYEDWFGNNDVVNCGTSSDDAEDVAMENCVATNKGTYSTGFTLTLVTSMTDAEVDDAVEGALTGYSGGAITFDSVACVEDTTNNVPTGIYACMVMYPWHTKSTTAESYIGTTTFATTVGTALADSEGVANTATITSIDLQNVLPRSEFQVYTAPNKFFEVVGGTFGVSIDLNEAKQSEALLSIFPMGIPLEGHQVDVDVNAQYEDIGVLCWENYNDDLFDGIGGLDVYWDCNKMADEQLAQKLASDQALVLATIIFIAVYMIFTTGSYFLAANGMWMIFFNFFPSMTFYAIISPYFGIFQVMAVFIILSIGADDVFVLLDTWGQTNIEYPDKDIQQRMTHTLGHAGKVMLTTSASTVISFLTNTTSAIPAIAVFGWFCGILVFCNYIAVCLFYPTVLMMHELYFAGENEDRVGCPEKCQVCSGFCRCGCRNICKDERMDLKKLQEEGKVPVIDPTEKRPIDQWFGDTFYDWIHKYKMPIIIVLLVVFFIFLIAATTLETDPFPPNAHPETSGMDGYNYFAYWTEFSATFTRQTSDNNVFTWIVFGIGGKGMPEDRGGIEKTKSIADNGIHGPGEGYVTYDDLFMPFGADEMEFMAALCEDMNTGARYGDLAGRLVGEQLEGSAEVIMCPIVDFRNWVWSSDPDANWDLDNGIDPYNKDFLNADMKTCITEENAYGDGESDFHQGGTWPIQGRFNNIQRYTDFMKDGVSDSKFGTTTGDTNYDYFSDNMWLKGETWDLNQGLEGLTNCDYTVPFSVKFMKFTVKLEALRTMAYGDGIDLYEKWDDWLAKWMNGDTGGESGYTPSTTHCDGYTTEDSCMDTNGCAWSATKDVPCYPAKVNYPGAIPDGIKSAYVTDQQFFAYYYLQEKLIVECFSGIGMAVGLAFVILNVATGNWLISMMATTIIGMLVLMVMGWTVFNDWKLGMLEAIIFVMVVGMSVDYVVHLAESYLDSKQVTRRGRTKDMLETRAFSVLSGAVSTAGGIFWLFFAYVMMFKKFSNIMFFLVCASLLYSIVFFSALLDSIGPEHEFGNWSAVFEDINTVRAGEMECSECCHNCIVPHKEFQASRSQAKLDVSGKDDDL